MPLKVYLRGSTYWISGTSVAGEQIRETTGTKVESEARKICAAREGRALETVLTGGKVKNQAFDDAAFDYLNHPIKKSKRAGERAFVDKLVDHFGDRAIRTITQRELDQAGVALYPGCQPGTVARQCHAVFSAIYRDAHDADYCDYRHWVRPSWKTTGTIFNGLDKRQVKPRVGSFAVSYEHAAKFVLAMSPAPAMVMTALFYSGMRPSELFRLDANHVNVKAREITVDWNSKTGEPRDVPMHEFLVPLFTELTKRGGILFRTPRGEPYPVYDAADDDAGKVSGQMKSAILGARKRSGIKDVSPYTARHSVLTALDGAGISVFTQDQITGHASKSVSQDYVQVPWKIRQAAINTLPVIKDWAAAPWLTDPLAYVSKLAEGTGARTDLSKLRTRRDKRAKVNAKKKVAERVRRYREQRSAA